MIYELRQYTAVPGKMPELLNRFEKYTFAIFEKHGMKLEGFWTTEFGENSNNELIYILSFNNYEHMETAWREMFADEEWINIRKQTEKNGPLVSKVKRMVLREPSFVRGFLSN